MFTRGFERGRKTTKAISHMCKTYTRMSRREDPAATAWKGWAFSGKVQTRACTWVATAACLPACRSRTVCIALQAGHRLPLPHCQVHHASPAGAACRDLDPPRRQGHPVHQGEGQSPRRKRLAPDPHQDSIRSTGLRLRVLEGVPSFLTNLGQRAQRRFLQI